MTQESSRIALKFAYLGTSFSGFQRQPDKRTVEGEIRSALTKLEISLREKDRSGRGFFEKANENPFGYDYASRTDSNVSAAGNVLVLSSPLDEHSLIEFLNSELHDIHFHSSVEVGPDFNPRHAEERWYRYFIPTSHSSTNSARIILKGRSMDIDLDLARDAARIFQGTHDFSFLSKYDASRNPKRAIHSIDLDLITIVEGLPRWLVFDVKGQSFLWMMVRFIIGAILDAASGRINLNMLQEYFEPPRFGNRPQPVPPSQLMLMDIIYRDLKFKRQSTSLMRDVGQWNDRMVVLPIYSWLLKKII